MPLQRISSVLPALVAALVLCSTTVAEAQTLNISDVSVVEGAPGAHIFTFSVTLTAPAGPGGVTFDLATADGTAQDDNPPAEDNDYVAQSLTGQNIPSGSTGPYLFQVTVNGDGNAEPNETFFVNVTNITGATAGDSQGLGTIQNDDNPTLTIDDVSRSETNGAAFFNFSVHFSTPDHGDISFDIATAPGTAVAGTDYVHENLHVELSAAVFSGFDTYLFQVTVNGNAVFEGDDTFFVNVSNVTGATVVDGQGLGTILNDDAAPSFSIGDVSLIEGDSGTQLMSFTVTKSGATELTHAVNVATADSSATVANADYVANSSPMTFLPSDTSKTFNVPINGDTEGNSEGNEQFFVNLSAATNGATIGDNQALGIIRTDDPVSITALNTPLVENFDGLSQTTAATTPPGWTYVESGASANATYSAGTGSSPTGDTYSFGAAGTNPITDRALGSLRDASVESIFGASYRNDTGATIQSLTVGYTGEQWRLGTAGRLDTLQLQYSFDATSLTTGTWLDVDSGLFATPDSAGVGAKDGNAVGARLQQAGQLGGLLSMAPGATVWIRFIDFDAGGADDGLAIDDFSIIADYVGTFLTVGAPSVSEGHAGTSTLTFTVAVNNPAPEPGGVTFDIATQDFTATVADNDYEPLTLVGENIPAGQTEKQYQITINGDLIVEGVEQFYVNVTNVSNALVVDGRGFGTIVDDDTLTPIAAIQGSAAISPMVGGARTIRGIVTGVKSDGFFVQEEDADADADPNTSEGIFVFTSDPPPAAAAFAAQVHVSGTVAEFVPSADPQQPPSTRLVAPQLAQLSTGNTLPAAIALSASFPDPAGTFDQLERVEHMRVTAASITVTGPAAGTINETDATGTSNGVFHGVITGVARPVRETGIRQPDDPPIGSTIPPIPRWDFNPERLRIESATINAQPVLTVKSGDVVASVTGPLDYASRGYVIYPDGTPGTPVVTPGALSTTVTAAAAGEFTVASFTLQRFFDTVDDAYGDSVLTSGAYDNRLAKASIAIRNHLLNPDIIAVQEVETLAVLDDLTNTIATDGGPTYAAYLVEGNDTATSLDIGFLVKTTAVSGGQPRVSNVTVTQLGAATTWIDPRDNSTPLLHDRPPLQLEAVINRATGVTFPIVVIGTHLADSTGIDSETPDGLTTVGGRVRQKRLAQAQDLANLVQARVTMTPGEHLVLAGGFNAFEVNDGYVDLINTVAGTPPPDNETVVPDDDVDLVTPDLVNLVNTPPAAERYSAVDAGNAANVDHALVSAGLVADTSARRIEHPRINADYPETERNNLATGFRVSDRDPVVAYFASNTLELTDLAITKVDTPDPALAGENVTYTITVTNAGPNHAAAAVLSDTLPANTTFVGFNQSSGPAWTCTTPGTGSGGTISCSIATLSAGASATFTLVVQVAPSTASGTVVTNTAEVTSSTADATPANNSGSAATTIGVSADLSVANVDTPDPVTAGANLTYTITVSNNGPSSAVSPSLSDAMPADSAFVSLASPAGWSCTTPPVGGTGPISCSAASLAAGANDVFTLVAQVGGSIPAATSLTTTATVASSTPDGNAGNNSALATTTVAVSADLSISTIGTPDPVLAGGNITYTVNVANNGPSTASSVSITDAVPANTTFVSASVVSGSGWLTSTPPVGSTGTVFFSKATVFTADTAAFQIVVAVDAATAGGTVVTNTATIAAATADATPGNNGGTATTTVQGRPTITDIANQSTLEDTATNALPFTIDDVETAAASLTVSASSNNQTLIPNANIALGGSGASRTVTVMPTANQSGGPVTITVLVSDGTLTASDTFSVMVNAVNDAPAITPIANQTANANATIGPLSFTVGDVDNAVAGLTVSGTSSNPTLVPNGAIAVGGSGANRTVTITPLPDQAGSTTITVSVSDGSVSTPTSFLLTLVATPTPPPESPGGPDQAPTLDGVADATMEETKTVALTLTVGDDATPAANLVVTATSSNAALLPASGVAITGAGGSRTLTLTPLAEQIGQTTVTVTVSDGSLTTTRTALLTVVAAPPPLPPTGLVGSALGTDVMLTWVEPVTGATPTFFVVEGGSAPGLTTLPVIVSPTRVTQWTLKLPAGVYFFRVRAANRAGTSARSNEAQVIVTSTVPVPGAPTGLAAFVDGLNVTLGWQQPAGGGALASWQLELGSSVGASDRGVFTIPPDITSVGGPLPAGEYFARVRGLNAAGPGQASNEARFRVGDVPACDAPRPPVLLPATVVGRIVTLAWRAPGNVAVGAYRLLVGSTPGGSDLAALDVGPVTSFVATAPPGVYHVTVLATNACGVSTPSNPIVVSVGVLDPPANLTATVSGSQVTLGWSPVAAAASYLLEAGFAPGLSDAATFPLTATGLAVTGVPSGTYYVRVRAVSGAGATSAPSAEIIVVIP